MTLEALRWDQEKAVIALVMEHRWVPTNFRIFAAMDWGFVQWIAWMWRPCETADHQFVNLN